MKKISIDNLSTNFEKYMNKVMNDNEVMVVIRKDNKNVVMLSEETYNNLMENIYVTGNKENYDWLMESKKQLEKGKAEIKYLYEADSDE